MIHGTHSFTELTINFFPLLYIYFFFFFSFRKLKKQQSVTVECFLCPGSSCKNICKNSGPRQSQQSALFYACWARTAPCYLQTRGLLTCASSSSKLTLVARVNFKTSIRLHLTRNLARRPAEQICKRWLFLLPNFFFSIFRGWICETRNVEGRGLSVDCNDVVTDVAHSRPFFFLPGPMRSSTLGFSKWTWRLATTRATGTAWIWHASAKKHFPSNDNVQAQLLSKIESGREKNIGVRSRMQFDS